MRPIRLITLAALALAAPAAAGAQGILIPRCAPGRDCPVVPPPCPTGVPCARPMLPARIVRGASHVRVTLADRVLHYEIDETFINRGGRVGEADYIFPLPRSAAFADFKLSINGELVSGETMDAERARGIYEEIVRRQRDPALVEWMGFGMLRTRIFPIEPGEEKRVVVRFDQVIEREGDALRIEYAQGGAPSGSMGGGSSTAQRGEDGRWRSTFTLTYPASSAFGEPYSPTHQLQVSEKDGMRTVRALGDSRGVTILIPARRGSEPSIALLANAPGREDGFALITLAPPAALRSAVPRDITLVLDVSGSMSGQKLEQARAAGRQLLATLTSGDRFRLIDFSSDVRTFRDRFSPVTRENVRAAERYLDALTATGGTNIAGALEAALGRSPDDVPRGSADRLPLVLFITDGEPTVGEGRPDALARLAADRRGRARLFTFGLGSDVNTSLLEQLALEGGGTAQFVRPTESVERAVALVASRLTNPVVTDLRLRADGMRLNRMLPAGPVDVFAGQDLVILARYSGSGRATLRFDGMTPAGPVTWRQQVDFPERERANAFIPRLWATQRVGFLSAERRRNGSSPELDDEIRSLGERFGIPTELTSFLVLEPGALSSADGVQHSGRGRLQLQEVVITGSAAGRPTPAADRRVRAFEEAMKATAQRAATSLAAADSATMSEMHIATAGYAAGARRVGDRIFALRDSVWTDVRYETSASKRLPVVRVRPYSGAYFKLLELVPELTPVLALGDRVIVMGRAIVIEVGPAGATTLAERDVRSIRSDW